jgi:predicted RND superfamily exporter protein
LVTPCADALSQGNLTEALLASWLTPLADPEELEDKEAFTEAVAAIMEYLNDAAGQVRANALSATLRSVVGEKGNEEVLSQLTRAVSPLLDPVAFVPKSVHRGDHIRKAELTVEVSGYPMIYAGMNRSVYNNQTRSMLLSCALVLLALTWFFRSGWLALAAAIPAGATLLITFGVMGFYEIPMDIGTSMIASIALGVGIDYAVHLLWKYGVPSPEEEEAALSGTLQTTGWGIIINALEVTVGFGLLALGTVVPMQNFGLLTALAMILSAIGTLALTPLLMKGVRRQLRGKKT